MSTPVFTRCIWGDASVPRSQTKIRDDFRRSVKNQAHLKSITYCFGRDNYDFIKSLGFEATMLHEKGIVYSPASFWFHKLYAWTMMAIQHQEFLFIDADMRLTRPLFADFWPTLREKNDVLAPLMQRARRRIRWRRDECGNEIDARKLPSAAFVYFRDAKEYLKVAGDYFDANPDTTEEIALAFSMEQVDPWKNAKHYFWTREPLCVAPCMSALPPDLAKMKGNLFSFR